VSIYLGQAMTGHTGQELWSTLLSIRPIYEKYGIELISPIEKEGILPNAARLTDRSDEEMTNIWKKKDKEQIRSVNVFVYIASNKTSQGVMKEFALARGSLWKPTVGVYLSGLRPGFITRAEDDAVVTSHEEAALTIVARWGTWSKRLKWRLKMLYRSLPKFVWFQLKELFR